MIFRWDNSSIQSLPDSMKVVFNSIVKVCYEVKCTIVESDKSSKLVQCVKEVVGISIRNLYVTKYSWCTLTLQKPLDHNHMSWRARVTERAFVTKEATTEATMEMARRRRGNRDSTIEMKRRRQR